MSQRPIQQQNSRPHQRHESSTTSRQQNAILQSQAFMFLQMPATSVATSEVDNGLRECQSLRRCRRHRVTFLVLTIATWLAFAAKDAWRCKQEKGRRHKKQYPKTGEYSNDLQRRTAQLYYILIVHSLVILLRINSPERYAHQQKS